MLLLLLLLPHARQTQRTRRGLWTLNISSAAIYKVYWNFVWPYILESHAQTVRTAIYSLRDRQFGM